MMNSTTPAQESDFSLRRVAIVLILILILVVVLTPRSWVPRAQHSALEQSNHAPTLGQQLRALENSPRGQQLKAEAMAEYEAEKRVAAERKAATEARVRAALDMIKPQGPPPRPFGN